MMDPSIAQILHCVDPGFPSAANVDNLPAAPLGSAPGGLHHNVVYAGPTGIRAPEGDRRRVLVCVNAC